MVTVDADAALLGPALGEAERDVLCNVLESRLADVPMSGSQQVAPHHQ